MDFSKIDPHDTPPALPPGEEAYAITLASGRQIFAACWTDADADARKAGRFGVIGAARAIERNGNPILRADLSMIFGQGTAGIAVTELIQSGVVNEARRNAVFSLALQNAIEAMLAELLLEEGI